MGAEQIILRTSRVAIPVAESLVDDALNMVSMLKNRTATEASLEAGNLAALAGRLTSGVPARSQEAATALWKVGLNEIATGTPIRGITTWGSAELRGSTMSTALATTKAHYVLERPMFVKGLESFGMGKQLRVHKEAFYDGDSISKLTYNHTLLNSKGLEGFQLARTYGLSQETKPIMASTFNSFKVADETWNATESSTFLFGKSRAAIDLATPEKGFFQTPGLAMTTRTAQVRRLEDFGSIFEISNPKGLFSAEQTMRNTGGDPINITRMLVDKAGAVRGYSTEIPVLTPAAKEIRAGVLNKLF